MSVWRFILPSLLFAGGLSAAEGPTSEVSGAATLDLAKVFAGSPTIYMLLFLMSIGSFVLWLYSLLTLRPQELMPDSLMNQVREQISQKRFEAALDTCRTSGSFSGRIIASGLAARKHGSQVMMEAVQSEGRRSALSLWQRISLLNDVVVVAPMFGLLGTVLGMFFAFYDTSRTMESLTAIFDGLGIAIGTTVAGLVVAILAMVFYTTLKFRVMTLLNTIENEAMALMNLVELEPTT
jgi:biopolymer transport protein ExbB